jgi:hypothetical protein
VRIEAVACVLAERAYEKAREGDLEEAVKLANQSLKLLEGVIEAHRGKAEVFRKILKSNKPANRGNSRACKSS